MALRLKCLLNAEPVCKVVYGLVTYELVYSPFRMLSPFCIIPE
jgi:hypothetical protein